MMILKMVLCFGLGVLLTLRVTVAVVRRARREEYARAHQIGFEEGRFRGGHPPARSGADSP